MRATATRHTFLENFSRAIFPSQIVRLYLEPYKTYKAYFFKPRRELSKNVWHEAAAPGVSPVQICSVFEFLQLRKNEAL